MIEHVFMIVLAIIASVGIVAALYIVGYFLFFLVKQDKDKLDD